MVDYGLWMTIFFFLGIFIYYVKNFIYFLFPEAGRFAFAVLYLFAGFSCLSYNHNFACLLWFGASIWCMVGLHLYRKKKELQKKLLDELNKIAEEQNKFFEKIDEEE